ncbi:uncharacterized protein LOC8036808 [Ixodes scapularis]|uniref:uncharacterized protein LOC8036808 n=1 Tax=Ixodes scapularis TaxID=6945 RepID=UPI001161564A|nr:uncharacterized protein LOC8036808 [Ixodes scapularis]
MQRPQCLLLLLACAWPLQQALCKEIDKAQDLQQEETAPIPAEHRGSYDVTDQQQQTQSAQQSHHHSGSAGAASAGHVSAVPVIPIHDPHHHHAHHLTDPHAVAAVTPQDPGDPWPLGRPDMPQIKSLNVKCEKNHMKVFLEFDRPFHGMIFSKGHYSDPKCVHLPPNTGHIAVNFDIFLGSCGMSSSQQGGYDNLGSGLFIEDTIIIQYDPQVQEIWDQARRLRCTWYDFYEKAVTFRPFNVDMLDAVTANFLGDNIQCWMQIQVGKGPWASEVAGIVKIGQTMTMVLAIKDDENKFDMLVRNCIAHDGKHQPIVLVDEYGCVARPKIMSRFQKIKNFGASASVVSYAYFQAFKFPDSMNVHFQCVIQVCRYECPEPKCEGDAALGGHYLPAPRDPSHAYSEQKAHFLKPSESQKQSISVSKKQTTVTVTPEPSPPKENLPPVFYNRQGEQLPSDNDVVNPNTGYAIASTGGMPRSHDVRKREVADATNIQTQKVIQVVAPGDVAFNLPTGENDTMVDVYSSRTASADGNICISLPGFAAGLIVLLLLLIVSSLVASFLFIRVRHIANTKNHEQVISYDTPEFVKVAITPQ